MAGKLTNNYSNDTMDYRKKVKELLDLWIG